MNPKRVYLHVEHLENRLAPATLVSPNIVTYQDADGDAVTVKLSKPLFTAANVANAFHFDQGGFNDANATAQQLQQLDLTQLGNVGLASLTITAVANGGNGKVNVGYIKSTGFDLTSVRVQGDLDKIDVGNNNVVTPALLVLNVDSIGKFDSQA